MTIATLAFGVMIGIAVTAFGIMKYQEIQADRAWQEKMWYESKQRRENLRRKMNEPREELSRNICEEARKGLQRRTENARDYKRGAERHS